MALFDHWFIRSRQAARVSDLSPSVFHRLTRACRDLTAAEDAMAERLGLRTPPRLLMVDEEEAVVIAPDERSRINRG